jgi:NitT/TauT family transport system permease protein
MITSSDWGLGRVIHAEFRDADVMLAALAVIGAISFAFERRVFGALERVTVIRWGMIRPASG